MSDRTIIISGDELDANAVKDFLLEFSDMDSRKGDIRILICSLGGWTNGAIGIFDAIRSAKNHVTTIGLGTVGSAAILVLQAGDKRLLGPHCVLFFHETWMTGTDGSASQIRIEAVEITRLHKQYCGLIAQQSECNPKTIEEMCQNETYVDVDTALKLGLADGKLPGKKSKK